MRGSPPSSRLHTHGVQGGIPHGASALLARGPHWRDLTVLLLIVGLVLAFLNFGDYGISNDEEVQANYGRKLWAFFLSGFSDRSAFSYIDLYYYGGLFDLIATALVSISPFGEYETRHLLGGLVGILGVAGAWRLGRYLGGERAGFLSALLLLVTPPYYGGAFNNPKDIPFAVGMIWTLYYTVKLLRDLPVPRRADIWKWGLACGLTLGVRVGAILGILYLLAGVGLYLLFVYAERRDFSAVLRHAGKAVQLFWPAFLLAYALMALLWPWGVMHPLNPFRALEHFRNMPLDMDTMVDGEKVKISALPAKYLPIYLAIKLPEATLAGVGLAFVAAMSRLTGLARLSESDARRKVLPLIILAVAAIFPIAYFLIQRPPTYNGIRHFLFVVPPLTVVAALGIEQAWHWIEWRSAIGGRIFGFLLAPITAAHMWIMAALHPDEYVYYNLFAGGLEGAAERYELDYWGNSMAEAVEQLTQFLENERSSENRPVMPTYKVAVCAHPLSVSYYLPPFLKLTRNLDEAEFFIAVTQSNCHKMLAGRQIITIERFGIELSMVKDRREIVKARKAAPIPPPEKTAPTLSPSRGRKTSPPPMPAMQ